MESGCVRDLINAVSVRLQKAARLLHPELEHVVPGAGQEIFLKNAGKASQAEAADFCEIAVGKFRSNILLDMNEDFLQCVRQGRSPSQLLAGQYGMYQCHSQKEVFFGVREVGLLDSQALQSADEG